MDPREIGFDSWALLFKSSIEPGGEFEYLLPAYKDLIDEILEKDKLEGVLEENTTEFLVSFIPTVTRFMVNQGYMQYAEREPFVQALCATTPILTWAFLHDEFELFNSLDVLFCRTAPFYEKNNLNVQNSDIDIVAKSFLSTNPFTSMKERCICKDRLPKLNHFVCFTNLIQKVNYATTIQIDMTPLNDVYIPFIELLELAKENNFQEYDLSEITQATLKMIEYNYQLTESKEEFFTRLINFCESMIMEISFERKMSGASILTEINKSYIPGAKEAFLKWSNKTNLCDYLITKDISASLLKVIEPVYISIMKPEHLHKLWMMAQQAHLSQKPSMLNIVAKSLKTLKTDEASAFIDAVDTKDASSDIIDFLVETAKSLENIELSEKVIEKVLSIGVSGVDVTKHISKIMNYQLPQTLKKNIVSKCLDKLNSSMSHQCLELIARVLKVSYQITEIIPDNFFMTMINFINNDIPIEDRRAGFIVIKQYVEARRTPVLLEEMEMLSEKVDDYFFAFISSLIEKIGSGAYTAETVRILETILSSYDVSKATVKYAKAVKDFVLIENVKSGTITNEYYVNPSSMAKIPDKLKLNRIPVMYDHLLRRILFSAPDKPAEIILDLYEVLYTKCTSIKTVTEYLINLLRSLIEISETFTSSENSEDTDKEAQKRHDRKMNAASRILELINLFRINTEEKIVLEDFGYQRHIREDIQGVYVYIAFEGRTHCIKTRLSVSPQAFRSRVAAVLGLDQYEIILKNANNASLHQFTSLGQAGIAQNSTVRAERNCIQYANSVVMDKPPSVIMHINRFQDILLPLLDEPLTTVQADELLSELPDAESVVEALSDMGQLLISLEEVSPQQLAYVLAVVGNRAMVQDFEVCGAAGLLVSKMISMDASEVPAGVFEMLTEMASFNEASKDNVPEVCNSIIKAMFRFDTKSEASLLLFQLHSYHKEETERELFGDNNRLCKLIQQLCEETWEPFRELVLKMSDDNQMNLFKMCSSHLNGESQEDVFFVQIFSELMSKVWDKLEPEVQRQLTERTIKLLKESRDKPTFSGLCKAAGVTLKHNDSDGSHIIADDLLEVALGTDGDSEQAAAFSLVQAAGGPSEEALKKALAIKIDRWSVDPSINRLSKYGVAGLRNLGATCYMNSIFQCLFATPQFLELLSNAKVDKPGHNELKKIFALLAFTKRKSVDTSEFAANWLGWNRQKINTKDQQDASEFLSMILDQLPKEVGAVLRGETKHTIENKEEGYSSSNTEDFYSIRLEVKGYDNVQASFESFLYAEHLTDVYAESLDKRIDCQKYARVSKMPKVVALALKRFEFDYATMRHIKVNDVFEYPDVLDLSALMSEKTEPMEYELYGTVLHSGTAEGGHYVALVRHGNGWIKCDDELISEITENKFFGGIKPGELEYDAPPSAFILFYAKKGLLESAAKEVYEVSPETMLSIRKDNEEFVRQQALFGEGALHFMVSQKQSIQLEYLLNVFVHSALGKKGKSFCNALKDNIQRDNAKEVSAFFLENHEKLIDSLMSISEKDVLDILQEIIRKTISFSSDEDCVSLVDILIDALPGSLSAWRQVPVIADAIFSFAYSRTQLAIEHGIAAPLTSFIQTLYTQQRSSVVFQNIDLVSIINTFQYLMVNNNIDDEVDDDETEKIYNMNEENVIRRPLPKKPSKAKKICSKVPEDIKNSMQVLIGFSQQLMMSVVNTAPFVELMKAAAQRDIIDLTVLLTALSNSKKETDRDMAGEILCDSIIEASNEVRDGLFEFAEQRRLLYQVLYRLNQKLKQKDEKVRSILLSQKQLIIRSLMSSETSLEEAAEYTIYGLFPLVLKPYSEMHQRQKEKHRQKVEFAPPYYHKDMHEFLDVVLSEISRLQPSAYKNSNVYNNAPRKLVTIALWLRHSLKSNKGFEVAEHFFDLFKDCGDLKTDAITFILSYGEQSESYFALCFNSCLDQPPSTMTYQYLESFKPLIPMLLALPKEKREEMDLWESPHISTLIKKFLDCSNEAHKHALADFGSVLSKDAKHNRSARQRLQEFFGPDFLKFVNFVIEPVSYVFIYGFNYLDDCTVLNYINALYKYVGNQNFCGSLCLDFLSNVLPLINSPRWIHQTTREPPLPRFLKLMPSSTKSVPAIADYIICTLPAFPHLIAEVREEALNMIGYVALPARAGLAAVIIETVILRSTGNDDSIVRDSIIQSDGSQTSDFLYDFIHSRASSSSWSRAALKCMVTLSFSSLSMERAVRKLVMIHGPEVAFRNAIDSMLSCGNGCSAGAHWAAFILNFTDQARPLREILRSVDEEQVEDILRRGLADESDLVAMFPQIHVPSKVNRFNPASHQLILEASSSDWSDEDSEGHNRKGVNERHRLDDGFYKGMID